MSQSIETQSIETPAEVAAFRGLFPGLERTAHLANNSKGALSRPVIEAHEEYLRSWQEHGSPWHDWVDRHERLRERFATMIGAQVHEVALCASVTAGLASLASALDWSGTRNTLAFDDYSFPSVAYLWHAQAGYGAQIRRVAPDAAGEITPDAFVPVLDEHTRLLSVAHVCYKNGHRLDLPAIADRAHAVGAWFVVDDYQCSGSRALDVRTAGIDVLTTGTVKFLLGSPGVAFLYVAEELLTDLHPRLTGWFAQQNPDDFQIDAHIEAAAATRFQLGTPAIPSIYDSLAGLELILSVGLEPIGLWIATLSARLMDRLDEEGFVPATPRDPAKRGPQVAVRVKPGQMNSAVAHLASRDVVVSSRDDNVRCAFHYYNTFDDIEALIAGLRAIAPLLERA